MEEGGAGAAAAAAAAPEDGPPPGGTVKSIALWYWNKAQTLTRSPQTADGEVRTLAADRKGDGTYTLPLLWSGAVSTLPNTMVNDNAVNQFLRDLEDVTIGAGLRVVVCDSHVYTNQGNAGCMTRKHDINTLCDKFFRHAEKRLGSKGLLAADLILVPMHSGAHWRLGVLDRRQQSFEVYDSLLHLVPGTTLSPFAARQFAAVMSKFMRRYADTRVADGIDIDAAVDVPNYDTYQCKVNEDPAGNASPRQSEVECGIMMLATAWYRVFGWAFNFSGRDATKLRMMVCYTVCTGKTQAWTAFREFKNTPTERCGEPQKRKASDGGDDSRRGYTAGMLPANSVSSFSAPRPTSGGRRPTPTTGGFTFKWDPPTGPVPSEGPTAPKAAPVVASASELSDRMKRRKPNGLFSVFEDMTEVAVSLAARAIWDK